ncbi:GPI transamidase component GPI16 [Fusarium oxysporum f. sp. albedinis]|nr:GPI transamidase component GPI16 [Fusarium oxysporum f. sp. albedinis]
MASTGHHGADPSLSAWAFKHWPVLCIVQGELILKGHQLPEPLLLDLVDCSECSEQDVDISLRTEHDQNMCLWNSSSSASHGYRQYGRVGCISMHVSPPSKQFNAASTDYSSFSCPNNANSLRLLDFLGPLVPSTLTHGSHMVRCPFCSSEAA